MTANVPLPHPPTPVPEQTDLPVVVLPIAECAARVSAAVEALAGIDPVKHQLTTTDLARLTQSVLAVFQLAESAAVTLTGEAITRGVVTESTAAGPAQWVTRLGAGEPITTLLPETGPDRVSRPLIPVTDNPEDTSTDSENTDSESTDGHDGFGRVVGQRVPGLEPGVVSRMVKVATACTRPKHAVLAAALTTNRVGVAAARTALTEVDKLLPVLPHSLA